jgi:hypothetical protein
MLVYCLGDDPMSAAEATVDMVHEGAQLAEDLSTGAAERLGRAFAADASTLRPVVSEYGAACGPTPSS